MLVLSFLTVEFRSNKQNDVVPATIDQDSIYKSQLRSVYPLHFYYISPITRMLHYQNQEKCIIVFYGRGI
jgi:hypothetical protein